MNQNEELEKNEIVDTGEEVQNDTPDVVDELNHASDEDAVSETLSADEMVAIEKDKYLRLYSDFENLKRRTAKERLEIFQLAGKEVILGMLPVLDDLERAIKASEKLEGEAKIALEGFELIYKKMLGSLESQGLKAMLSVGLDFDAELHEAVTKIPAPSEELKGKIVDELEKGYLLNEKVIRFAKVVIGE